QRNATIASTVTTAGAQDHGILRWDGQPARAEIGGGDGAWTVTDSTNVNRWCVSSQYLNFFCQGGGGAPPPGGNTAFIAPYVVAPSDPDRLYAGRAIIFRSDAFGIGWTATNGGAPIDGTNMAVAMAVSETDADVLYVTTAPDRIPGGGLRGVRTGAFVT